MGRWQHLVKDKANNTHRIEELGWDKEKAYLSIDGRTTYLKMYYRYERTWDDHMGNTPCGYYVVVPIKYYRDGYHTEYRRVYLDLYS